MGEFLLRCFYHFMAYSSCILLGYLPLKDRITRPLLKIVIEMGLFSAASAVACAALNMKGIDTSNSTVTVIFSVLGAVYYMWTVNGGYQKRLFVLFMCWHVACIPPAFDSAFSYLAPSVYDGIYSSAVTMLLFHCVTWIAVFLMALFVIQRYVAPCLRQIDSRDMAGLWLVPLVYSASTVVVYLLSKTYPGERLFLSLLMFFVFLSFPSYILFIRLLHGAIEKTRGKAELLRIVDEKKSLERLELMRTELIAAITHETMTPLAVLSGYAELIANELRRKSIDDQIAKDLDSIAEEAERISLIMDELNNHVRKRGEPLLRSQLNLPKLIADATKMYTPILSRKKIALTVDVPESLPDAYACANEITQVLFNLLQNAHAATTMGTIVVAVECEKTVDVITVKAEKIIDNSQFICVSVCDSGSGIAPELLPKVFERGMTGGGGTGLGLPICKEIIEAHGGKIGIVSEVGKGTTVFFTLPVWKEDVIIEQDRTAC